jgi:membrane protein YdbS with pleckstrin-like domain
MSDKPAPTPPSSASAVKSDAKPAVIAAAAQQALAPQQHMGAPPPEDERPVWDGNPSWKAFYPHFLLMAIWVAAISVGYYFAISPENRTQTFYIAAYAVLAAAGVVYLLIKVIYGRYYMHYRLTTQRIFLEKGLLGKTVDQTELVRVEDVQFRQNVYQRMMGIGNVHILAHDLTDGQIIVRNIDDPRQVSEHVRTYTQKRRARSVYVENV